jgi:hypothetical protein
VFNRATLRLCQELRDEEINKTVSVSFYFLLFLGAIDMKVSELTSEFQEMLNAANGSLILDFQVSTYFDHIEGIDHSEFDAIALNFTESQRLVLRVGNDQVSVDLSIDGELFKNKFSEFGHFKILSGRNFPFAPLLLGKRIQSFTVLTDLNHLIAGVSFEVENVKFSITNQGDCLNFLDFVPQNLFPYEGNR